MRTPLAWLNLWHEKTRTGVATAGVAFAVILILMQLGFYMSTVVTSTRVYDQLIFDIVLVSPSYQHLSKSGTIPKARLLQTEGLPEVASVRPLYMSYGAWLNRAITPARRRGILVMGTRPEDKVFKLDELNDQRPLLKEVNTVLMDTISRPEFGPRPVGWETDVGRTKVRVVGEFTLGTGFSADGAIAVSETTYASLFPERPLGRVNIGLVSLVDGADVDAVADKLRKMLPVDTRVFTKAEIYARERHHWVAKTSVGVIFGMGVIVAIVVGIAIVYQVLSSDIANRLPEYATLKAMGYRRGYLTRVILMQAATLAVAGFLPGLLISIALYRATAAGAHIPMELPPLVAISVLLLTVGMCALSGWLSLRKVHAADPADLFR